MAYISELLKSSFNILKGLVIKLILGLKIRVFRLRIFILKRLLKVKYILIFLIRFLIIIKYKVSLYTRF
jgi:hypothetical protein